MRRLTTLPDAHDAQVLGDILEAEGIEHRVEPDPGSPDVEVWVLRDDAMDQARELLQAWRADPGDARFAQARERVRELRRAREQEQARRVAQREREDRTARPVSPGFVTIGVIVVSAVLTLLGIGSFSAIGEALTRLPASENVDFLYVDELVAIFDPEGGAWIPYLWSVRNGEIWRLFTPAFLHTGGLFHLGFNAYWFYLLGQQIETRKGPLYLLILVLMTGMISTVAQYTVGWALTDLDLLQQGVPPDYGILGRVYLGGPLGGGLSGVLYGLFGFILAKSNVDKFSGLGIPSSTVALLLIWLLVCFAGRPELDPRSGATYTVGIAGNIANIAHLAGLLTGGLWGLVSHRIRPSW